MYALKKLLNIDQPQPTEIDSEAADLPVQNADTFDFQPEDAPHYLRLTTILDRIAQRLTPRLNNFQDFIEEYGVYNTAAFDCTVPQQTTNNIEVCSVLLSFDPSITAYTLTLGRKVFRITSAGAPTGFLPLTNLNIRITSGDTRSFVPVTGTPGFNSTMYITGYQVRLI